MRKNFLPHLLILAAALSACDRTAPSISVVCEENNVGDNIVKWETYPAMQGEVEVFASTDPDNIPEEQPKASAPIPQQYLSIAGNNPAHRYYYTLLFDGRYRVKTAARNVVIPGIENVRDMGGYPSYKHKKQVRWGMIYRSAGIGSLDQRACDELANLRLRTIIDLRTSSEARTMDTTALRRAGIRLERIPIPVNDTDSILDGVLRHDIDNDSLHRIVLQMNRYWATQCTRQYRQMFDLLLDRANYPLLICCASGKGRTGVASALLLSALGVDEGSITDDYALSNRYLDIPKLSAKAYELPTRSQIAITTLLSAREDFLNAAHDAIEQQYGSIEAYLNEALGLDRKSQKRLQDILLEKD